MTLNDITVSSPRLSATPTNIDMSQITARLPDTLLEELDAAASRLKRTRAQVVRQAIEYYLDDLQDLHLALERLQDPSDAVLDWADVKREILDQD
jgi:RHH-type rel operon transcriptional repressor/antitoxin RelB